MYRVLVVEDNKAILRNLTALVEQADQKFQLVGSCGNGKRALEFLEIHEADIIITDIRMPVIDGLELIHTLEQRTENMRYIIVSGYDEFEYARKAVSLGVSEYLLKPVDASELYHALEKVSGQIRMQKEKQTLLNSGEKSEIVLELLKQELDAETERIARKMMPVIIRWDEEDYLQMIGSVIDVWFERQYSRKSIRVLLISLTELILRNKGYLDRIDIVQPIENILLFSDNYLSLRRTAVDFFRALYEKINSLLIDESYSSEQLYLTIKRYLELPV